MVLGAALLLAACSSGTSGHGSAASNGGSSSPGTNGSSTSASTSASPAAQPVHVRLTNSDNTTVGIGMPIIAYFSKRITSAKELQQATTITVNGAPAQGWWYFETSAAFKGYPIEGHLRLDNFWPAHATIHVAMPIKGLAAGTGLAYDDSLTLDFATGPADIATVDDASHTLHLTMDGVDKGTYPVSLGASNTRTRSGTKIIMEKGASICMRGPGYYECGVKYTQRLTYDGEYLHSAPWNVHNITSGVDSSNGCTNLLPADAQKLYGLLEIGDVVQYPNANGGKMQLGQGYGDWNVPNSLWHTGGLVSTA
jgi:lipoprotein-anchoring transpeptidase ErfK/SrfK